jgi:predicted RNA methylase
MPAAGRSPKSASRILELGCPTGALGAALKNRQDAVVVGVEIDPDYAACAGARLDRVIVSDVESFLADSVPAEAPFDCLRRLCEEGLQLKALDRFLPFQYIITAVKE